MNESPGEQEGVIAVIKDGDTRAAVWREYFGGLRVPVTKADADFTALPDGTKRFCFFVDFDCCPNDWLIRRLASIARERNSLAVCAMLEKRIYPIVADGVTTVRASRRFLQQNHP